MAEDTREDGAAKHILAERFNLSPPLVGALKAGRKQLNEKHDPRLQTLNAAAFNQFLLTNVAVYFDFYRSQHGKSDSVTGMRDFLELGTQKKYPATHSSGQSSDVMSIEVRLPEQSVRAIQASGLTNEASMIGGLILLEKFLDGKPYQLRYEDGGIREYPFVDQRGMPLLINGRLHPAGI